MGIRTKIKEYFGEPKGIVINTGKAVLGEIKQVSGSNPEESFYDQVDMFNGDPCVKETIIQFAEHVCSTGIFTTKNERYTTKLPSVGSAKDAIDKWNKDNDLDNKILQIAIELTAFGNSFWYIGDNGFQNIPVESIQKAEPINTATPLQERYNLRTTPNYKYKLLKWGDFIHFKINTTGHEPFGSGICLGLISTPDTTTPSLWALRKSIRTSMKVGFEKFSFGNELWTFEGLSDEATGDVATKIANMDATGNRIATNTKGNIILSVPQRTQAYDSWIDQIDKEFYMSLGGNKTPNTEYTTKATAEALAESYKYKIAAFRRIIKRQLEGMWSRVLDEMGFDSYEASVKLNFGSEEISIDVTQIMGLVEKGIITKNEARKNLLKVAKLEMDSEELPEDTAVNTKLEHMEEKYNAFVKEVEEKRNKDQRKEEILKTINKVLKIGENNK